MSKTEEFNHVRRAALRCVLVVSLLVIATVVGLVHIHSRNRDQPLEMDSAKKTHHIRTYKYEGGTDSPLLAGAWVSRWRGLNGNGSSAATCAESLMDKYEDCNVPGCKSTVSDVAS